MDVGGILCKILGSITGENYEQSNVNWVQCQLCQRFARNRYLLVLDDVWTENRNQWQKLEGFLLSGQSKSCIVVTTRSYKTASIIGAGQIHELQGLLKENSWHLFRRIAFGSEQSVHDGDLVKIGQEIVEKCAGVPLALRVAGSLLYGKNKSQWILFQKNGFSNSRERQNDIMSILKLSYHQLESPLKSCFTYCALFPKGVVIEKGLLISLWMAQGFIVPLDVGQRIEDAADQYFSLLLQRFFFQDVECDEYGEIFSVYNARSHA